MTTMSIPMEAPALSRLTHTQPYQRERDKPRLSLKNNTAGVCELSEWSRGRSDIEGKATRVGASECGQRTSFNRTREAGNRDKVEGAVANTLNLYCNGASLLANAFGVRSSIWLGVRQGLRRIARVNHVAFLGLMRPCKVSSAASQACLF
jgi:hypothetical protein